MVITVLCVVAGYVLGALPTAVVVGRRLGHDPTHEGSGNPGASNVYRTVGRRAAAVVLAGDLLKGAAAAGLGWALVDHTTGVLAGAAAVVGHVLPPTRRGGKGVATSAGIVMVLFPLHGLAVAAVWAAIAALTRRPSVASLVLAAGIPVAIAVTGASGVEVAVLAAVAVVVIVRHRSNIVRLVEGDERPIEAAGR